MYSEDLLFIELLDIILNLTVVFLFNSFMGSTSCILSEPKVLSILNLKYVFPI